MTILKDIQFANLGWNTAADIYLPPDFDEAKRYPAIVSTHPIGSCKEQTSGNVCRLERPRVACRCRPPA